MDYKILSKLILDCINEQSGDGSALIISKNFTEMADAFNDYLIDNNRTDEFYIDEYNVEKDFSVQFLSERSVEESVTFANRKFIDRYDSIQMFYDLVVYYEHISK